MEQIFDLRLNLGKASDNPGNRAIDATMMSQMHYAPHTFWADFADLLGEVFAFVLVDAPDADRTPVRNAFVLL